MPTQTLPIVDFSSYRDGSTAAQAAIVSQVAGACEATGFFIATGHGVPEGIIQDTYDRACHFFDLPLAEKMRVARPRPEQNRGYIGNGEERLSRLQGGESPPDVKEVFAIGPDAVPDEPYFTAAEGYPNFAPNLWPREPAALRATMLGYWQAMDAFGAVLTGVFARGLGLPEDFFADKLDKGINMMRLLWYPEPTAPALPGQFRAGEHSDLGLLTLIRNEASAGGLQVKTTAGEWIDAPAVPGSFVVNLGDLMMRWTNDRWRSTPHRVVMPPAGQERDSRRLSMVYFILPNYDAVVAPLPSCVSPANPARYPPTTVAQYRNSRFAASAKQVA